MTREKNPVRPVQFIEPAMASSGPEPEHFPKLLHIRKLEGQIEAPLHAWVIERSSRQLGKFASQVERIEVRFGDENGPKGGVDRKCLVHVVLSSLPSIAIEMRGATEREAFDLAMGRAGRALK